MGQGDKRERHVTVEDAATNECPVSLMLRHPELDVLASEIINTRDVKEATGAVLFGPDSSRWPVRWYDTWKLAELAEWQVEQARKKVGEGLR